MILSITVKEITFWNGNLIYVITEKCVIYFWLEKFFRKRPQICDRCSLEHFAMHGRFHLHERTHRRAGSVTRIAVKY